MPPASTKTGSRCHQSQFVTIPHLPPLILTVLSDVTFFHSVFLAKDRTPPPPQGSLEARFHTVVRSVCEARRAMVGDSCHPVVMFMTCCILLFLCIRV